MESEGLESISLQSALARPLQKTERRADSKINLQKLDRPPARFDLLTNSLVYRWQTTAQYARKISGPMREWATQLKYRTGVHLQIEPTYPQKLLFSSTQGGYASADDVQITVYLFGSDRGIHNCHRLMQRILQLDPAYVRLAVFRRIPQHLRDSSSNSNKRERILRSSDQNQNNSNDNSSTAAGGDGNANNEHGFSRQNVQWLTLRRINRELRPPDIPPISLKTPGKWTLLFEQYEEAAIRTLWEQTGISVQRSKVYPTGKLNQSNPAFYWRVPVYYFIAQVPYDVEVRGPQVALNSYVHGWDEKLLRQSPDPIDRAWAVHGNPLTACAWIKAPLIDELQRPLRGDDYMAIRYTPPPYSNLASVLGFDNTSDNVKAASQHETNLNSKLPLQTSTTSNNDTEKSVSTNDNNNDNDNTHIEGKNQDNKKDS